MIVFRSRNNAGAQFYPVNQLNKLFVRFLDHVTKFNQIIISIKNRSDAGNSSTS
jgi:hypothetical protein